MTDAEHGGSVHRRRARPTRRELRTHSHPITQVGGLVRWRARSGVATFPVGAGAGGVPFPGRTGSVRGRSGWGRSD